MRTGRTVMAVASAGVLLLAVGACSNQTVRDLEGVPVQDPEKIELYVNVDKYPNFSVLCVHGVGFVTTTRDGQSALQESPGLTEKWCAQ